MSKNPPPKPAQQPAQQPTKPAPGGPLEGGHAGGRIRGIDNREQRGSQIILGNERQAVNEGAPDVSAKTADTVPPPPPKE